MSCAGKKGRGRGGGGGSRGVRGVDYGLGIGYNPESNNASSQAAVPSRSAAVNSLRTGMMAQFKSNFVAASSNSQNQSFNNSSSTYTNKRPALPGFVAGGSIGGDINRAQTTSSLPGFVSGGSISGDTNRTQTICQSSGGNTSQNHAERLYFSAELVLSSLVIFMFC